MCLQKCLSTFSSLLFQDNQIRRWGDLLWDCFIRYQRPVKDLLQIQDTARFHPGSPLLWDNPHGPRDGHLSERWVCTRRRTSGRHLWFFSVRPTRGYLLLRVALRRKRKLRWIAVHQYQRRSQVVWRATAGCRRSLLFRGHFQQLYARLQGQRVVANLRRGHLRGEYPRVLQPEGHRQIKEDLLHGQAKENHKWGKQLL